MLDGMERGLLQTLQIAGRVAFSLVGEVLGVSDRTIARRYARLRAESGVRVSGVVWPEAVGRQLWRVRVRVRCVPEAAVGPSMDGRVGFRSLSAATGWSEATVRRRLAELRASGVVYFDVDFDPVLLGLRASAALWLSVAPGESAAAGRALAETRR
ncbi:AsnC family transcriptional regulator [Streptomyces sp. GS7]|uniref:AsnC family transcriptional regulator n=1 Tax=Streptomyces sp. GS7 TaxID=2692234 RepID=UPI00191656A0|nr:AsnC family transcriptional regulator [Streptomyces sp. GS7]